MSNVSRKVEVIFRELVGDLADRLSGSRYLADVNSRIAAALCGENASEADLLRNDSLGFHVIDWQAEAAFIVALALSPERFTDEEIKDGVESLLIHAPAHILEAARLAGHPTMNIFPEDPERSEPDAPGNAPSSRP